MRTESVTTGELRQGDRVLNYGMVLLIDLDIKVSKSHPLIEERGAVLYTHALIENWDEVCREADEGHNIMRFIRGLTNSDIREGRHDGKPRWTIQGNNLARWARVNEEEA